MAPKTWNPLRLNVPDFVREGASLSGEWPAVALARFAEGSTDRPASGWAPVRWQLRGERRAVRGAEPESWVHLAVDAQAQLTCQRCLQPVAISLQVDRWFLFVGSEHAAAALDADRDEDVLVASRGFDTREWIEDELLLALPIVPMHDTCPRPLPQASEAPSNEEAPEAPHPFAALGALKARSGQGEP